MGVSNTTKRGAIRLNSQMKCPEDPDQYNILQTSMA